MCSFVELDLWTNNEMFLNVPVFLGVYAEYSFDDSVQVEAPDVEGEGSRPVGLDYLAVFDREVVERVGELLLLAGLVLEPDELAVLLQDEVPLPPVLDVLP